MGGSYMYAYGFATMNTNAISTSTNITKEGKTTLQFINVPNNSDEGGALGFGKRMEKQKADFSINIDLNSQRNANRINGLDNVNNSYAYSAGVNGSKWEDEKYMIHVSSKLSFNYGTSSLRKDVPVKYYSNETELNLWFKMWWKLEFNLDSKINLRQKTDAFDVNRNVSKIDLHLRKKFGKSNNGEIQFSCFDLLDQNIGFRRSINTNIISENSYSSLRRYFMLSAIFSFSKTPK
jgi:hypothetical protein